MNIKLEPHAQFKRAIQAVRPSGRLVYNYWRLIEVCQDLYEMSPDDAVEPQMPRGAECTTYMGRAIMTGRETRS